VAAARHSGPAPFIPHSRPNAQAANGRAKIPATVTSLKAMSYGSATFSRTVSRLGRGK
jgi:hypothetical protein